MFVCKCALPFGIRVEIRFVISFLKLFYEVLFAVVEGVPGKAFGGFSGIKGIFDAANLRCQITSIVGLLGLLYQCTKLRGHIRLTIPSFEDLLQVLADFRVNVTATRIRTLGIIFDTLFHLTYYCIKMLLIPSRPLNVFKLSHFLIEFLQPLRSLPVTLGQLTDDSTDFLFIIPITFDRTVLTNTLQHPFRKRYSRIAQPMRSHVRRCNASAGDLASLGGLGENTMISITNEFTKPNCEFSYGTS
ncbi:sodium:alanine symporter family protein [Babesia caballi]|uniref:Sodium:alanine symporter family protein n=1 Tax=Babesia caballi TaxID=5871 RepID=A0AAV4LZA9_BABCB|nr:sodium:alanine symporter family protein [Babesia caballi]